MKIVNLLSGGLDSTVLAYYLKDKGHSLHALSFNYGQKHSKELRYAGFTISKLQIHFKLVDITSIMDLISKSALIGDVSLPQGEHYTAENQKLTVVPNRNAILLSLATGHAVTIGADAVAYAAHFNDYSIYPDCREDFVIKFQEAMRSANELPSFNILAPFIKKEKSDLVKIGLDLGVDFSQTWSCYKGMPRPCLKCATCLERTEAFHKNRIRDPILTDDEWTLALKYLKETGNQN